MVPSIFPKDFRNISLTVLMFNFLTFAEMNRPNTTAPAAQAPVYQPAEIPLV
jgi:hypothetical protein